MTPFGSMLRDMRRRKGVTQKEMAAAIGVSAAYLSALEHGRRGMPSWPLLQKIIGYFNVIWDEADAVLQVAARSHPKVTIDTAGLSPAATELANLLAVTIDSLAEDEIEEIIAALRTVRRG
ncbi:helix-turn-helix domain-containing protein [Mesorhizobium xinjiangense]|uniref:helix-turn-helix domain-containing protein n=1 Tax=Mesorhizobium xinjiangense TaxID=2678685 RepID=UPI0012EE39A5|nr:helix-turn-helix transcriptional regulator [Mesorhizobium xinjiangense]